MFQSKIEMQPKSNVDVVIESQSQSHLQKHSFHSQKHAKKDIFEFLIHNIILNNFKVDPV